MSSFVQPVWMLTALCVALALAACRLTASEAETQPTGQLDPISLKAIEVFLACEQSIGPEGYARNPNADWGWSESRIMMAYQAMYEGTGDEQYLSRLLEHVELVLAARGDRRGLSDEIRGKMMPGWITTGYTKGKRHAFLVHAGMITYPMARCVAVLRRDPQLAAKHAGMVEKILTDVDQTIQGYEEDYREGPGQGEGYYYCPMLQDLLPYNQQNALGRTLVAMYLATGKDWYRQRAEKLARYFKNRLKLQDGRYVWDYWSARPGAEDVSHASINVDFAFNCHRIGAVFDSTDMKRFLATFRHIARPDGFADFVDGSGQGHFAFTVGAWGHLGYVERQVRQVLIDYLGGHWRESSVLAMLAAGYLVETRRPFRMEHPSTAPAKP